MTPPRPRILRVYDELKRRRVFGSAAAYVVLAALLIELSSAIFEALLLPEWATRLFTVLLVLGFPLVVVLAWFFDLSSGGLTRTEPEAPTGSAPGGLQAALARSRSVPVPAAPLRRRARSDAGAGDTDGAEVELDAERVRAAALGHVRHELRTPINGIIGYAEMLLEDVAEPDLVADLERIRTAGRQLLGRVDAVLRPERLAGEGQDDLEAFAEQVRVDLRTPINAVVGYGEMLVETCREEGRDHLIPDLERILASARRLLELSEDIVGVATAGEAGTSPGLRGSSDLTRAALSRIRPVEAGGRSDGEGRLLVVDDNETNRDLLSRQLARHGYSVATAADGQEGLERLEQGEYDLVLLDVIMPRMNGVELLARLQADERWADVPVIMLSSLDEVDSAVRCIEMGALDYVSKPVEPTLLGARIAAALELRELRRREQRYRRRVDADGALIDRLLDGAVPAPLRGRVADGALDATESYSGVTAVRCRVAVELQPTAGSPERIRDLAAVLAGVEELAERHGAEICLWRPDGFLAIVPGSGQEHVLRAAALVEDAAAAFGPGKAGFGVHTGDAVGGILGRDRPRFELWGEAVETAEALARQAGGEVLVTQNAEALLRDAYALEPRGIRDVGGTQMRVHRLLPAHGRAAAGGG